MADARQGVPPTDRQIGRSRLSCWLLRRPALCRCKWHSKRIVEGGSVFGPYWWEFGDGSTAHTATPSTSRTCQSPGSYTATVTAGVPPGCPATPATVTVTAAPAGSA